MNFLGEVQRNWIIDEIDKEALGDFRRDFNGLVDVLSPAFTLDGSVYNDASRREHGVDTPLTQLDTYVRSSLAGGYLLRDETKIKAGLYQKVKHGKFQGWVEKIAI